VWTTGAAADEAAHVPELAPIAEGQEARPGAVIHLEYTVWDERGELLGSTGGQPPIVFTLGKGEVIAGLERAVVGMKVGERKRVTVPPTDAFGPVDPDAMAEVARSGVPAEAHVVGASIPAQTPGGRHVTARVREVREDTLVLDLNHPLAGRTLVFEVKIVLVEPP
ncbi:MAG: FKBP-type peptidyl-prolyl cis-trans isomerase, partial [Candidatus Rokuibacteriota bacterium]